MTMNLRVRQPSPWLVNTLASKSQAMRRHTMLSVTKGVGVHARRACDSPLPENCLNPSLEAFLRAVTFRTVDTCALQTLNKFMLRVTACQSWEERWFCMSSSFDYYWKERLTYFR